MLLLVFLLQLLALFVVEGILYLAGIGEEEISLYDPELGWQHRRDKRVTWRREGYSHSYFGPDGLRERDVKPLKQPGTFRIVLVGDSLTEGLQEPLDKTFGKLLEKRLEKMLGRPVEVINFGVFGYSTVQEYLLLKRMLPQYHPDLVVVNYSSRDMAECLECWTPKNIQARGIRPFAIKLPGKPLEISSQPVVLQRQDLSFRILEKFEWFKQNSRIWGFFATNRPQISLHNALVENTVEFFHNPAQSIASMMQSDRRGPSFKIQFFEQGAEEAQTPPSSNAERVPGTAKAAGTYNRSATDPQRRFYMSTLGATFSALLEGMKHECQANNAALCLSVLPARPPALALKGTAPTLFDVSYDEEIDFVTKGCAQQDVPILNCHSLAAAQPLSRQKKMYYLLHYTAFGHQFIAEKLVGFLSQRLMSR